MRAFWQHFSNIGKAIGEFSVGSPRYQISCVLLAISRLLQVVSFFLPLKILIMLSSNRPPSYLEYLPFTISYDTVLILFICMVPATYGGYIIAGILHRFFLDKDLARWKAGDFTPRFIDAKEKNKIIRLHAHVAKALSEVILVVLSLVLISYVDFPMFVIIIVMIVMNLNIFVLRVFYKNDQDRIGTFKLHRRQYIEYTSSINFVFVFIVLAVQVKYFDIGVFEALFVLLLSRMMFQAVQRFSVENLYVASHLGLKIELLRKKSN